MDRADAALFQHQDFRKVLGRPPKVGQQQAAALVDHDDGIQSLRWNMRSHGRHGGFQRFGGDIHRRGRHAEKCDALSREETFPSSHIVPRFMGETEHQRGRGFRQILRNAEGATGKRGAEEGGDWIHVYQNASSLVILVS